MEIILNGEKHTLAEASSVLDLLHSLTIDPQKVAVEMDRQIIRPPQWDSTTIRPGVVIEIVHFVGGG